MRRQHDEIAREIKRDQLEAVDRGDARVLEIIERELPFADDQQVKLVPRLAQDVEEKRHAFF